MAEALGLSYSDNGSSNDNGFVPINHESIWLSFGSGISGNTINNLIPMYTCGYARIEFKSLSLTSYEDYINEVGIHSAYDTSSVYYSDGIPPFGAITVEAISQTAVSLSNKWGRMMTFEKTESNGYPYIYFSDRTGQKTQAFSFYPTYGEMQCIVLVYGTNYMSMKSYSADAYLHFWW